MANFESEPYRRLVAKLPCVRCNRTDRSQAAHANTPPFGKGLGIKAHDWAVFPLCADEPGRLGCHTQHDRYMGGLSKCERIDVEAGYIAQTFGQLMAAGKLKVAS